MVKKVKNSGSGPVDTSLSPLARWKTLGIRNVSLNAGFWTKKIAVNRTVSLRFGYEMLARAGNFDNLRLAAGSMSGKYRGYVFQDSDIYKWLEAVAWELGARPDAELFSLANEAVDLIAAAQLPCGYINSYVQTRAAFEPWSDLENGHELYCAGHLFQAAIAFRRALGEERLFVIARRFADHVVSAFGPEKRQGVCGHPQVEMALVELYRETGEPSYRDLAKFFIDQRGHRGMKGHRAYGPEYHQDHIPVRQVQEAAGHAVRQVYLASGVTDIYLETGEQALFDSMLHLWNDITETKQYITGGLGARYDGEAFGDPYELPPDQCYCETCAAIASFLWNWRMLLATGQGRYGDQMERALYNNILASPALDGKHFFYVNPLQLREARFLRLSTEFFLSEDSVPTQRPEWHACACCPPNVMRLFSSLSHYLATADARGVQIHHYAPARIEPAKSLGQQICLSLTTEYPWQGAVHIQVVESSPSAWALSLRIPEWSQQPTVAINGKTIQGFPIEQGYLVLERAWRAGDTVDLDLGMEVMLVTPNPRIDAVRGCLAIQRGPLVYCLEDGDQIMKGRLLDVEIDPGQPLFAHWDNSLLEGMMVIQAGGQFRDPQAWRGHLYKPLTDMATAGTFPAHLIAVPYFAWGNRGIGAMRVWIPRKTQEEERRKDHDRNH